MASFLEFLTPEVIFTASGFTIAQQIHIMTHSFFNNLIIPLFEDQFGDLRKISIPLYNKNILFGNFLFDMIKILIILYILYLINFLVK